MTGNVDGLRNALYSTHRTHGVHNHDGAVGDMGCEEYIVGVCSIAAQPPSGDALREALARRFHKDGCDHSREIMVAWWCRREADRLLASGLLAAPVPPLWGPDGPAIGQVVTIAGSDMQARWTGTHWERVE